MSVVNGKRQGAWFGIEPEPAAGGAGGSGPFAGVVFNRPIDQVFSYRIPSWLTQTLQPGARVKVPLGRGNSAAVGYCVRIDDDLPEGVEPIKVKEVVAVIDHPPLIDAAMLELTRWMGQYYSCSWGQALDAVVPAGVKKQAGTRIGTFLVIPEEVREKLEAVRAELPPKQAEVMAVLGRSSEPLTVADLCRMAKCAPGPIAALRQRGLLHAVKRRLRKPPKDEKAISSESGDTAAHIRPPLSAEQESVLEQLTPALLGDAFATFLIHGVTGSGKTEVYLSAIEAVVARGREAIVLVPEISLTPQTIRRFKRRFSRVAVLHSHLSDAERHRHWQSIAAGEIEVVVGARSAVFAPARRLGLIVIDEEHESTFKQETTPRYHARDVAVKRAQLEKVPVLLGSATPSLESWQNAVRGRFTRLALRERVKQRPMPEVALIDLRHEKPPLAGLSETLQQAMSRALDDGGQVLLLLNRRGFQTFAICINPQCGKVLKCDACDVAMTYHRDRHRLICHACDAERSKAIACRHCNGKLHYGGIGTERLENEVKIAFPLHVVRRMDSDTMRSHGSHESVLSAFKAGEVDILLGTQMIAKGLDFPNVTLVGVVDADTALHMPDFRSAERTFQLVAQVAGRTGRGDRPGLVLVQTRSPDVAAIERAVHHDYEGFIATELPARESIGLPPFGRLVRVMARGADEPVVRAYLARLTELLREAAPSTVRLLGPAPAPVSKIRNLYRYHLRMTAPTPRPLQELLRTVPATLPVPHGVELAIDVDPVNML